MALLHVKNVLLRGVASCVPKNVEENASLSIFQGSEAEKFSASTGIFRRRIADDKTSTADLCYHATEQLIAELGWEKESIECLVFVSQTPDYRLPATSCILQDRLGLSTETYAIDISLGCSGWVYGLATISQMMSASGMKRGLLLTGDIGQSIVSKEDKSTYPLFGDCGTATAFEYDPHAEPIRMNFNTDGAGYRAIIIEDGGGRNHLSEKSLASIQTESGRRRPIDIALNGMDVFSFGISQAPKSVNTLLEYGKIDRGGVDYYLFHQANLFMNEKIRKKLKLLPEQVPYSLTDFGNTSSASIPLTMTTQLREALRTQKLKLVACGFGVGLSWGSIYLETDKIVCPNLIEI